MINVHSDEQLVGKTQQMNTFRGVPLMVPAFTQADPKYTAFMLNKALRMFKTDESANVDMTVYEAVRSCRAHLKRRAASSRRAARGARRSHRSVPQVFS